jgi:hypothetical protein
MLLRLSEAEMHMLAPNVRCRVLFPRFGAVPFTGIGPLRAVHWLDLDAGSSLPARRMANLSVLRLLWTPAERCWLVRQDCGAGAELPGCTATEPLQGVELWVQSRRSNARCVRHEAELQASETLLARPGDPGWDAGLLVFRRRANAAAEDGPPAIWWQQLTGQSEHRDAGLLQTGDGLVNEASPALHPGACALDVRPG